MRISKRGISCCKEVRRDQSDTYSEAAVPRHHRNILLSSSAPLQVLDNIGRVVVRYVGTPSCVFDEREAS